MKPKKDFGGQKNPFGGGNPFGMYVPMSEDEQEVLARIFDKTEDLEIVVHGWTTVDHFTASFGDHRVGLEFRVDFDKPEAPVAVPFLDLELRFRSSRKTLLRKNYPLIQPNGKAVQVCRGVFLDLGWDIAIDHMTPELVKALKPGALGLTSRRLDKDTQQRTVLGNMDLDDNKKKILGILEDQKEAVKKSDEENLTRAIEKVKKS